MKKLLSEKLWADFFRYVLMESPERGCDLGTCMVKRQRSRNTLRFCLVI